MTAFFIIENSMKLIKLYFLTISLMLTQNIHAQVSLPNFNSYKMASKKKKAFFNYLLPLANKANQQITQDKNHLLQLQNKSLTKQDEHWLKSMAQIYQIHNTRPADILKQLQPKVDIIPSSLLLAQAANESAWGTSRFAQSGNNLFGQWCFTPNCGIVPLKRNRGKTHEVRRFSSPFESIYAYALNLNAHPSYQALRQIRQQLRKAGKIVTGFKLAQGLSLYSARRNAYVHDIQAMIRNNHLE